MSKEIKDVGIEAEEQNKTESIEDTVNGQPDTEEGKNSKKKKTKKVLTPEQKKHKRKMGWAITGVVLALVVCLLGIFTIVNVTGNKALLEMAQSFYKVDYNGEQLVPELDDDGYWTFTTDKDLKIVQFTDVHIGAGFASQKKDSWALNAVAAMITAEKPDLVIVTGDIAYPVPFQAGTFNNLNATKIFANLMESLGVYWTFTYGNHDTEAYSYYDREDICEYYESQNFQYCLFQRGPADVDGFGNSIIKVKNTSGIVTQAIVTIDSHSYTDGDALGVLWKYDNIHQNQVDWYAEEIDDINAANQAINSEAAAVKSIAFFHIALREYRNAWAEYSQNGYQNTENVTYIYGNMGESNKKNSVGEMTYGVYCGVGDDQLFEVGQQKGLQGIFVGHDHYNNFSVMYKGIRLTYGMSIDYLAYQGIYKEGAQRGCTLITVRSDGSFDCEKSNYYQDKYVSQYQKEHVTK